MDSLNLKDAIYRSFIKENELSDSDYVIDKNEVPYDYLSYQKAKDFFYRKDWYKLLETYEQLEPSTYTYLKPKAQAYFIPFFLSFFLLEEDKFNISISFDDFIFTWAIDEEMFQTSRNLILPFLGKESITCLMDFFKICSSIPSEYQEELMQAYLIGQSSWFKVLPCVVKLNVQPKNERTQSN